MTADDIKTVASVVSVLVACGAFAFAYYQWKENRNTKSPAVLRDEIRAALAALLTQIDTTRVTNIQPNIQNWEFGFISLEALRSVAGTFNTAAANSRSTPDHIKLTANGILQKTSNVIAFRDSLHKVKGNRPNYTWQDYQKWPDRPHAENALHELQGFLNSRDTQLRDYLRELSNSLGK